MQWSSVFKAYVGLGIVGSLLLGFPDMVARSFPLRIVVSCCLLTVLGVFVSAFFLFKRAVSSPISSIGVSTFLAGISYISALFGLTDRIREYHQYLIVFFVLSALCSVMAATYIDSSLQPHHHTIMVVGTGLASCTIAAVFDYPQCTALILESTLYCSIFILRRLPRLKRLKKTEFQREKTPPPPSNQPGKLEREEIYRHPLVLKGFIVNPETMRNIKIGAKKYTDLVEEGYKPDFTNGVLVWDR